MCNLFEYDLLEWEVKELIRHYKLLGRNYSEVMRMYPRSKGHVIINAGAERVLAEMQWGFPSKPPAPPSKVVTNIRHPHIDFWAPWIALPEVEVDGDEGGRCLVPCRRFAEPDQLNTGKAFGTPSENRWFGRPDGGLMLLPGVWRTYKGERRFAFMTAKAHPVVAPFHRKATPVIFTSADAAEIWQTAPWKEAKKLHKPANDDVIIRLPEKKAA